MEIMLLLEVQKRQYPDLIILHCPLKFEELD